MHFQSRVTSHAEVHGFSYYHYWLLSGTSCCKFEFQHAIDLGCWRDCNVNVLGVVKLCWTSCIALGLLDFSGIRSSGLEFAAIFRMRLVQGPVEDCKPYASVQEISRNVPPQSCATKVLVWSSQECAPVTYLLPCMFAHCFQRQQRVEVPKYWPRPCCLPVVPLVPRPSLACAGRQDGVSPRCGGTLQPGRSARAGA